MNEDKNTEFDEMPTSDILAEIERRISALDPAESSIEEVSEIRDLIATVSTRLGDDQADDESDVDTSDSDRLDELVSQLDQIAS